MASNSCTFLSVLLIQLTSFYFQLGIACIEAPPIQNRKVIAKEVALDKRPTNLGRYST